MQSYEHFRLRTFQVAGANSRVVADRKETGYREQEKPGSPISERQAKTDLQNGNIQSGWPARSSTLPHVRVVAHETQNLGFGTFVDRRANPI